MARIIRTYKETLPSVRFVGKCYTSEDRVNGSFAHKWEEWFTNGWFEVLEKLPQLENVENGYLGWMRSDLQNSFEYWIGMFLPVNTQVPEGFDYIDIGESDIAVCWIKGREEEVYSMHDQCVEEYKKNGLDNFRRDGKNRYCFFERYQCPRFTQPDENGELILDYAVYLDEE